MNTGIIASRYAKALLRYVTAHGDGERTCRHAMTLEKALSEVPELRQVLNDPAAIPESRKLQLLQAALGDEPMCDALKRFLALVARSGRFGDLLFILHDFSDLYYKSLGVHFVSVVTAVPASEALLERIRTEAVRRLGGKVVLETRTDPSLLGGAVVTADGYRVDASVRSQLRTLQNQFINKNKRIV